MSDTFITFRGEPDILVEYKVYGDICGQGPDAGELEWWFCPDDAARFGDVTAEEDEAVIDLLIKLAVEDRYSPIEGDVGIFFAPEPGERLGTPLSEISGRPGHAGFDEFCRIAKTYGYD